MISSISNMSSLAGRDDAADLRAAQLLVGDGHPALDTVDDLGLEPDVDEARIGGPGMTSSRLRRTG